jgi:hypothetical protein
MTRHRERVWFVSHRPWFRRRCVSDPGMVDSNVDSLFFRSAYEQRPLMSRRPHCRTLDEMRALRMPAPTTCEVAPSHVVVAPSHVVVAPPATHCHVAPVAVQYSTTVPCTPVATCQLLTICQFYPYVCNHNRQNVRDWCLYCTRRFLFPEEPCTTRPMIVPNETCHYVPQNNVCVHR